MNAKDVFSHLFFYRQHPDAALRYLPILDILKKRGWENLKILEVGSGSYGITPYLKKEIIGVDVSFDEPEYPLLKQIKGSATSLPFTDSQFDIVILSDVLEHLPKNMRAKSLEESVRVGKTAVIIAGPFGRKSFAHDKKLAEYSREKTGGIHKYFKDHLEYGLPDTDDISKYLRGVQKIKGISIEGEYLNLSVREWIMKIFIIAYAVYLKGLMFLVPLLKHLNQKPCYRTIIIAEL